MDAPFHSNGEEVDRKNQAQRDKGSLDKALYCMKLITKDLSQGLSTALAANPFFQENKSQKKS